MIPGRGGIILGNAISPLSGKVKAATIFMSHSSPFIAIAAEQEGRIEACVFDEMTSTELWAAYNFITRNKQPGNSLRIEDIEKGLVGKTGNLPENAGWRFRLHPAIARTFIAWDAMRLDMSIAASGQQLSDLSLPEYQTYQWHDAPAILRIRDGFLRIKAASEPSDMLLRIRFWAHQLPTWVKSVSTLTNDFRAEVLRRSVEEAGGEARLFSIPSGPRQELVRRISREITNELEASEGNLGYDERRLIEKMSREFDAFRKIERFARIIAVLHWIAATNPRGLPPLPRDLQIKRFDIPARLTNDEVRLGRSFQPSTRV